MTVDIAREPGFTELIAHYEEWRKIYVRAGRPARDEPTLDGGRLNLRYGYPHMDWTGYVIEPKDGGYQVSTVTTERREEPSEYPVGFFSDLEDAGKYIIWMVAIGPRSALSLPSISQAWREDGLDPRVKQISLDTYVSKFELKSDPSRYFVLLRAGGVQPENRLLPLTYDQLDAILLEGMPESVKAG